MWCISTRVSLLCPSVLVPEGSTCHPPLPGAIHNKKKNTCSAKIMTHASPCGVVEKKMGLFAAWGMKLYEKRKTK